MTKLLTEPDKDSLEMRMSKDGLKHAENDDDDKRS